MPYLLIQQTKSHLKPSSIKMSARKETLTSQHLQQGTNRPHRTGDSSGLLPRKRARLSTTALNEPHANHNEDSSSLSSASDSDESTKMVAAFIGEDSQERLRLAGKEEEKHKSRKGAQVATQDDEMNIDTTSSQMMVEKPKMDEENLRGRKLDLKDFIAQIVSEENGEVPRDAGIELFRRNPFLTIKQLNDRGTPHIVRNKVSDKFNRRDVQFYDLYVKMEKGDDLARLKEAQLPLDIDADQYYNDLEVDDFNKLFRNDQLIGDKFGTSIKVNLELANPQVKRRVVEHIDMVKHSVNESSPSKMSSVMGRDQVDPELIDLNTNLKKLEREFGKNTQELADLYCKVSGQYDKMREYLEGKPSVVEWNYLEDLALTKPEDSPEFQVLLSTKGIEEIRYRRNFLNVTPIMNDQEDANALQP